MTRAVCLSDRLHSIKTAAWPFLELRNTRQDTLLQATANKTTVYPNPLSIHRFIGQNMFLLLFLFVLFKDQAAECGVYPIQM